MAAFWSTVYRALSGVEQWGLLLLVFVAVALAIGTVSATVLRRDAVRARLFRLAPEQASEVAPAARGLTSPEEDSGFVARVTEPLHKLAAPADASQQKSIRLLLTQAGLRSPNAYRNYLGLKVLLGLLFPFCYLFISIFYRLSAQALVIALALGGFGFLFPTWVVRYLVAARKKRIGRALPDALDLMVVCAEAGLGLDMILKRVGDEIRPLNRDLSDEYRLTNLEVKAGKPRPECLKNMTMRTGVQEVGNLMTILVQASRFGTSIAQALRVHADGMRVRRRQVAEELAGKLMVKLLFPLVLFIFPAIFVVLVGPAGIRIANTLLPALSGR